MYFLHIRIQSPLSAPIVIREDHRLRTWPNTYSNLLADFVQDLSGLRTCQDALSIVIVISMEGDVRRWRDFRIQMDPDS